MISIDMEDALATLGAILGRARDMEPILSVIGAVEAAKAADRIQNTKEDPEGDAWIPWRPGTKRERMRQGTAGYGLLYITGGIARSQRFEAGDQELMIGSSNKLALFHQFGTRGPGVGPSGYHDVPRPFLGWEDEDLPNYARMIADYIEAGL
ncbi:MAG: phage virion morphogenesis protein [Betaproteobacteria bacterium]|nr:phage virion morphogenesis protein [Betaproteobacteria bacterium]